MTSIAIAHDRSLRQFAFVSQPPNEVKPHVLLLYVQ